VVYRGARSAEGLRAFGLAEHGGGTATAWFVVVSTADRAHGPPCSVPTPRVKPLHVGGFVDGCAIRWRRKGSAGSRLAS